MALKFYGSVAASMFALAAVVTSAQAMPLNIDFGSGGGLPAPSNAFGAAAGQAGNWNVITAFSTPSGIVDLSGNTTGVSISIFAESMTGLFGGGPGDASHLMRDYFHSSDFGGAWGLTISGLDNGTYDVYLYDPAPIGIGTGLGMLSGIAFPNISHEFSGVIGANAHFILLTGISVTDGTISANGGGGFPSGLAGMQLVQAPDNNANVPTPGSLALLGLGLFGIGATRRRKAA